MVFVVLFYVTGGGGGGRGWGGGGYGSQKIQIMASMRFCLVTETVFQCSWLEEDEMSCFKYSDDFIYSNNQVTDQLTLEIPKATDRISGTYRCQLVPPEDPSHPADPCALLVTGRNKD